MTARSLTRRSFALTGALSLAVGLAACGGSSNPLSTGSSAGGSGSAAAGAITVGSANFPESELLMNIYAGALKAKGVQVATKPNIGSREVYIPALEDGSIDVIPEYTGVLADYFAQKAGKTVTGSDADTVYSNLTSVLPTSMKTLDKSAAEDKDAVVVTKETADKHKLSSIADLKPVAGELVLGGPSEWTNRATGIPGLKRVYGVTFKEYKPLDAGGPLTVNALKNGQIDAGNLFTTDPNIAANDFVVLEDPDHLFPAQNVVPLLSKSKSTPTIDDALNAVSMKLDTQTLGDLVKEVVIDKKDASAVADQFLKDKGLGG